MQALRTSPEVQWLGLHTPNAGALGSIPSLGSRSCIWQPRILCAPAEMGHSLNKYVVFLKSKLKKMQNLISHPRLTWIRIYMVLFLIKFHLFIYFWPCWVFIAARGFSLAMVRAALQLQYTGFSLHGFSWCRAWAIGSMWSSCSMVTQQLQLLGSEHRLSSYRMQTASLWHVESFLTRDWNCDSSYIGRQILYHWVTWEAPESTFLTWFPGDL